jgi:hypothetical protein
MLKPRCMTGASTRTLNGGMDTCRQQGRPRRDAMTGVVALEYGSAGHIRYPGLLRRVRIFRWLYALASSTKRGNAAPYTQPDLPGLLGICCNTRPFGDGDATTALLNSG